MSQVNPKIKNLPTHQKATGMPVDEWSFRPQGLRCGVPPRGNPHRNEWCRGLARGSLLSRNLKRAFIPRAKARGFLRRIKKLKDLVYKYKNEEKALLEVKDKFQDFFDNAPVGYHSFGPNRIIYEINQAELDMIGFSRDEVVGKKTWADLILPEQKPIFERHWEQINMYEYLAK